MNSPTCSQCDCVAGCSKNPEPCPNLLAERVASRQVSAAQIERNRKAGEIHSCSMYCERPACVKTRVENELKKWPEQIGELK